MAYKYSFQAPDGQLIEFESPTMLTRDEARSKAYNFAQQRALQQRQLEQTAEESRGVGGALRDIGLGLGAGILGPIGEDLIGGGLTLLGAEDLGEAARETFGEDAERLREMQTPQLKARQQLAQQRLAEVEGEGFGPEARAAVSEYLRNPSLLFQLGAETLPQLIPIARAGRLAQGTVRALTKEATEKTLQRVGLGGAASAAGALQGSSVGMETYDRVFEELVSQGMSESEASEQAIDAAQKDAAQAGLLTIATTYAIPGAGAVERAVVGRATAGAGQAAARRLPTLRGAGRGAAGEALQEGIEEGAGAYITGLSQLEAGADIDPMAGVGTQAGIGALLGGLFGGPAGAVQARRDERARQAREELEAQQRAAETQAAEETRRAEMAQPTPFSPVDTQQLPLPGFEPGALEEAAGPVAPETPPAAPTTEVPTARPTGQRAFDFRSDEEQLAAVERELSEINQTYADLSRSQRRQVRQGLQEERDRILNRIRLAPRRPAQEAAATFEEAQPDLFGMYTPERTPTPAVETEVPAARPEREVFGGRQRELELGTPVEPVTLTEERLAEFGLPSLARRPDRVRANFKKIARRFEGLDITDPVQRRQAQEQLDDVENRYSGSWVEPFSERMRQELQATEQQVEALQAERERIGLERAERDARARQRVREDVQPDITEAIEAGIATEEAPRIEAEQERRRAELRQQLVDRQAERVREQARGRIPLTEEWKDVARTQLRQRQEEAQMRERGLDEMAAQEAADFELDMQYVDERTPQLEPEQKVAASDFVQQYTEAQAIGDSDLTQAVEQEARAQLGRQQWGRLKSGLSSQRRAQQRRLEQEARGEIEPTQPDLFAQPEPEPTPEPAAEPAPALAESDSAPLFSPEKINENRLVKNKSRERLVNINIDDFLNLAEGARSERKLKAARELVAEGKPFRTIPALDIDRQGKVTAHEGRHRALALKEAGYTTMPVVLKSENIRWSEQDSPSNRDYVEFPEVIEAQEGATNPQFQIPFPVSREDATRPYGEAAPAPEPEPEPTPEPQPEAAEDAQRAAEDAERAAEQEPRRRPRRRPVRDRQTPVADERAAEPSVGVDREREPEPAREPAAPEGRRVGRRRAPAGRDTERAEPSDLALGGLPPVAVPLQRAFNAPTEANTDALLQAAANEGILSDAQLADFQRKIQAGDQARAKAIVHVYRESIDNEYFRANPDVALDMARQVKPLRQMANDVPAEVRDAAQLIADERRRAIEREVDEEVADIERLEQEGPVDDDTDILFSRMEEVQPGDTLAQTDLGANKETFASEETQTQFEQFLQNGDNEAALRLIESESNNEGYRTLARRLINLGANRVPLTVVNVGDRGPSGLNRAYGVAQLDPNNNTVDVFLRGDVGLNQETLLHENIHAALMSRYDLLNYYLANEGMRRGAGDEYLDIYKDLYSEFRNLALKEVRRSDAPIWLRETFNKPDEFITYALTSPEMQAWLRDKPYSKDLSLWQKFKEFIQEFLGISGREPTWLDAAIGVSNRVLDSADITPPDFLPTRRRVGDAPLAGQTEQTEQLFSRTPFVDKQVSKAEQLRNANRKLINKLKDQVDIEIVQSATDVPELDIPSGVRGVYYRGKVYIIADAASEFDFETVIAHEVVGHAGMEGLLGRPGFNNLVDQINRIKGKNVRMQQVLEQIRREYTNHHGEYHLDDKQEAREIIAHIAESKANYLSDSGIRRVWDNITRRVRAALAKLGFIDPSDVLLDQLIYEAALHVEGGRGALRKSRAFLRPEAMAAHTMQRAWDKGYRGFDLREAGIYLNDVATGRRVVPDRTQENIEELPLDDSFYDDVSFSRRAAPAQPVNDGFDTLANQRALTPRDKPNPAKEVKKILRGDYSLFDTFRVRMVDAAATVEDKIMRRYNNSLKNEQGLINPMVSYVQSLRSEGLAAVVLRQGSLVFDKKKGLLKGVRQKGVASFADVVADLAKLGERIGHANAINRFHAATVARRELEIDKNNAELQRKADRQRSRNKNREAEKIEEGIVDLYPNMDGAAIRERQRENRELEKLFSTYPELQSAFDKFTQFKNGQLDTMVEAGVLSKEYAKDLKENIAYVPFNRLLDDADPNSASGYEVHTSGLMRIGEIKRLRGSPREVDNVLDNMAKLSMWMTQATVRNHAAKELARGLREVEAENPGTAVKAEYKGEKQIPAEDRPNSVSWKENGKLRFMVPMDPRDVYAWRGTESATMPMLRPFAAFANFLRKGITLSPDFIISQLQQDTFRVYAFGGLKNGARGASRVAANWWRIRQDLRNGQFGDEGLNQYGIVGQYDYMPEQARQTVEAEALGDEIGFFGKVVRFGERNAEASDLAQRKAVYDQTLADTNDETMAFWRASESINFNRRGTSQLASVLRQIIPFMNAYMQGMNVLGKSMVGRGLSQAEKKQALGVFWGAMTKLSILSGLYALMNADDDEYVNQPPHIRTRFFLVPLGDDLPPLKLAMPADLAFITKALPEAAVMQMMRDDIDSKKAAVELRDAFMTAVSGPNFTPQLIKPSLEAMVNYNFFTGAPIVGLGEQYKQIDDQYRESTSQLARLFSDVGISPLVADHLLKGYLGTLGSNALVLTDIVYEEATGEERTKRELADYPISRVFFNRTQGTGFKQDFYSLRDQVRAAVGSLNLAQRRGDVERFEEIKEDSQRLLRVRKQINRIENTIEKSNRRIRQIQSSNLSAEEKRNRIDREREFQARLAPQIRRIRGFVYDQ